jgi:BirA family biotin operon repressor/biotin-[acetyl-CoA-carboxylase] ligase
VGIGINVNQTSFAADLRDRATSLKIATGTEWSRVELAAALLKFLDREYRALLQAPRAAEPILRRFSQNSSWVRGREVTIEENGDFTGTTDGLDERGFLRIRTGSGVRTVLSGTVRAT